MNKKRNGKDSFQIFLRDVKKKKLLTGKEEKELAKQIEEGNDLAKKELIEANLRLVIKIAKKITGFNRTSLVDRIQDGIFGLMKAVEKFDYRRGYKFSTCATRWITDEISRDLNKPAMAEGGIGIPDRKAALRGKISRFSNEYAIEYGHEPTADELVDFVSERIGKLKNQIRPDERIRLEEEIRSVVEWPKVISLDIKVGKDGKKNLVNLIEDERKAYRPENASDVEIRNELIEEGLKKVGKTLGPEYEDVIRIRYYLFNGETKTKYDLTDEKIVNMRGRTSRLVSLQKIGLLMGVSSEAVRQREVKALNALRGKLRDYFNSWAYS